MAKARYFKTSDGNITYFRASSRLVYHSATWAHDGITFHQDGGGAYPVSEITRAEYNVLIRLKEARVSTLDMDFRPYNRPSDSWVSNDVLPPKH